MVTGKRFPYAVPFWPTEITAKGNEKFRVEIKASWRLTKAKEVNSHPCFTRTPIHLFIFYEPPSIAWISKYLESLDSWAKLEFRDRSFAACCKSLSSSGQAEITQHTTLHTSLHGLLSAQERCNPYSFTPANFTWQLRDRRYRTVKYRWKKDKIIIQTGSSQEASALYQVKSSKV